MKNTIRVITLIVLTVLFFNPLQASGQMFFMKNENIGKEAQDFRLRTLKGKEVSLGELRRGRKTVIFFWATWCPHCRVALTKLDQQKYDIENKKIKLILVDVGESEQIVNRYMEKNNIDMDVFMDEKSEVTEAYGVVGLPTFCFINKEGIIKDFQNGLPDDLNSVFEL